MRRVLLLALASILLADDPPASTQPEQPRGDPIDYFGIQTTATHVVFVIDRSGSMFFNPKDEPTRTKVGIMREETDKTIADLKETTSFAILFFARETKPWRDGFVAATDANKREARNHVAKEGTGGPTHLWAAIRRAFQYLEALPQSERSNVRPAVYLLTDGKVPEEAQKAIREGIRPLLAKWKPVLNVVSFERESPFLEALAKGNGGKLVCPVPPKKDK